jgi:membrane-associated protein
MELIKDFLDFFLHLDKHLFTLIQEYGTWIYVILFLIIFTETGLVVIPFLPGDSLLFAAGTFCAGVTTDGQHAELNLFIVLVLLIIAAISGDALNYFIGKTIGAKVIRWRIGNRQLLKQKYIDQTHDFFNKTVRYFVYCLHPSSNFVFFIHDTENVEFIKFLDIQS